MANLTAIQEDAPATSPIHQFQVSVEDGQIHVTADPAQTTAAGKARPPKVSTMIEEHGAGVVVVGGGSGAYGVIESLREFGYKKSITVISKEPHAPIDRYACVHFSNQADAINCVAAPS
jgi:hypothetical protein